MARPESDLPKLRRTKSTLTVLWAMFDGGASKEHHGYELAKHLNSHQAVYAIFRKLEAHGLVSSRWDEVDGRRRRYYRLTGDGIDYCHHVFSEQHTISGAPSWRSR